MSLPGAERYGREPEPDRARSEAQRAIDRANAIPIQDVLRDRFGIEVPRDLTSSWKTRCPFGFEHADGDASPGMRVYPTNTAFCFVLHGFLSPVKMVMMARDCGATAAARELARTYGLEDDEPYWERMGRLIAESEQPRPTGFVTNAAQAMVQALHRIEGYDTRQYDEPILSALEERMEVLNSAVNSKQPGALRAWLDETVECVKRRIEE